jgi:CubicO group peptidase (beta-lactamase class C family)
MRAILKIVTLLYILFTSANAQQNPAFITDSLDNYILLGLEKWKIPGAAVLIVKDGNIVISKGYGVKEFGSDEKVDENTLFMIGSNTKAFTGTALALLENQNKLSMEDKVIKYLPDFRMKEEWITKELNLTDIVSHRMGYETFRVILCTGLLILLQNKQLKNLVSLYPSTISEQGMVIPTQVMQWQEK